MSHFISLGFLTPPAVFIWLTLVGIWLSFSRAPLGLIIALVSGLCLYATSMPLVGSFLLERIEAKIPDHVDFSKAQAIVVLGGGVRRGEVGMRDSLDPISLDRVVMAAEAYRKYHLPIIAAGAGLGGDHPSEAMLMRQALDDFSVPVAWVEGESGSTYQNALFSERLLKQANINTVIVVTQAWHMPRALWAFEHVGLHALPWPTPRDYTRLDSLDDLLPNAGGLTESYAAFHEMLGAAYYRLHY
jgi:uncharacterized SAM-binding protein YcdF (DUF218 family)